MENSGLDIHGQRAALLEAALEHVPFDGWSEATFRAAATDCEMTQAAARMVAPRGSIDLAVDYHRRGDAAMKERLASTDLGALKFSEKVAAAVRFRIEAADREVVRRGAALFSLPHHAPIGAGLIWGTADAIWKALGDTSRDYNWYTKRATLSAVYTSVVLFWMGDESADKTATWSFLDRRIADVMRFEKTKARLRENEPLQRALTLPRRILATVRAPEDASDDLPGGTGR